MHQRKQSCKNHLTTGEAERLLTTASRLIVATETIVLNESGKGWTNSSWRQKRADEEQHLPLVQVRCAWANESPNDKSDEVIHLDHFSSTQKEHQEQKSHKKSANGSTSVSPHGRIPIPPPSKPGCRSSNLQSLSDSALFQSRASMFSHEASNLFNHQPANGVISEDHHQADDELSLSEKGSGVKTAVDLVNGKQSPANKTELIENHLVEAQFDKYSDKEASDGEQHINENDIQVIDLQEQHEKTEVGSNKEDSLSDEAASIAAEGLHVGKENNDQVGVEGNRESIAQDKEDSEAIHENEKQQQEVKVEMATGDRDESLSSVDHKTQTHDVEPENMLEHHSVMIDAATQTQSDKSTQTTEEKEKREHTKLESVNHEQLIQEANRMLRLLRVLPSQVQYEIEIHTGPDSSAVMTASVQLVLFGDAGNSGVQCLQHSSTHQIKFQPGSVDVFTISCAALGKLKGLKVWHDNIGASPSWLLEKVVVREGKEGIADFVFDCNRWLIANENENSNPAQDTGPIAVLYCTGIILKGIASPELENALLTNATQYYPETAAHLQPYSPMHPLSTYSGAYPSNHGISGSLSGLPADLKDTSTRPQNWRGEQPVVVEQTLDEKQRETDGSDLQIRKSSQTETPHDQETVKANQEANQEDDRNDRDTTEEDQSSERINIDQIDEAIREEALKRHLSAIRLQQYFKGFVAGSKVRRSPNKSVEEVLQERIDKDKQILIEEIQRGQNIHQAAQDGNLARIELLIDHNATLLRSKDEHGWSALHKAAAHGHTDCIKFLVAHGIQVDEFTPTGYCPIHLAAMNGHTNCLQVLKGFGSNISQQTIDQQTPLHLAASRGFIESCRWLISNRANLKAVDSNGRTPEDIAEEYGHKNCVKLIKECSEYMYKYYSVCSLI
jgi:hypothetical protein